MKWSERFPTRSYSTDEGREVAIREFAKRALMTKIDWAEGFSADWGEIINVPRRWVRYTSNEHGESTFGYGLRIRVDNDDEEGRAYVVFRVYRKLMKNSPELLLKQMDFQGHRPVEGRPFLLVNYDGKETKFTFDGDISTVLRDYPERKQAVMEIRFDRIKSAQDLKDAIRAVEKTYREIKPVYEETPDIKRSKRIDPTLRIRLK